MFYYNNKHTVADKAVVTDALIFSNGDPFTNAVLAL